MTDKPIVDMMQDVIQFHEKYGLVYIGKPRILPEDLFHFRRKFHEEETREWADEQPLLGTNGWWPPSPDDITKILDKQLDALADSMYVLLGTAYLQFGGERFSEAWRRVHAANMKKVLANPDGDERSHRDAAFDVVKPEGWTPPSHIDLVEDHSHRAPGE